MFFYLFMRSCSCSDWFHGAVLNGCTCVWISLVQFFYPWFNFGWEGVGDGMAFCFSSREKGAFLFT
jgi:hypothetical protein